MPTIRRGVLGVVMLSLLACRPGGGPGGVRNPGKSAVPTTSAPGGTATAPPRLPGLEAPADGSAGPLAAKDVGTIPLSAHIVRDLRRLPLDFAFSAQGTWWSLDADGLWRRTDPGGWLKVTDLTALALVDGPLPEMVVDGTDRPWVLDRQQGRLWRLGADDAWEAVTAGMKNAKGLSVGSDGTAYALASTATYYRVDRTGLQTVTGNAWKEPATTGVGPDGQVFVVDPGNNLVSKPVTGQVLAPVPSGLGALSIGRDADGAPLIVGGTRAPVVVRVAEKALTFPKMPSTVMPSGLEGLSRMRLFVKEAGRVVVMTRQETDNGALAELREGYAPGRKPGQTYAASPAYTGMPMQLRAIAEAKAAELGKGYQLYRVTGRNMDQFARNGMTPWVYEFIGSPGEPMLAISLGPLGFVIEQVHLPLSPSGLVPIGALPFDADQAWAYAIKAGMTNNVSFDVGLEVVKGRPAWRLNWVKGGQTYRVDALSGDAVLEGSAADR